ncbi:MAG: mannitol-1-phosphate 5-dehydrogenase [Bacteroidales bacterium]|nr:mannitol-1-phosphate 5-dehydrogenase [Bacteroidales bacterium]
MKKAIQFGAGSIGRGLIGEIMSLSGYQVVFADLNPQLVSLINAEKNYDVHVRDIADNDYHISDIYAVNTEDDEIADEILKADIITTAVGSSNLRFIAPVIAKGLTLRRRLGHDDPLNIMACENGLNTTSVLRDMIYTHLEETTIAWCELNVGFVDCAIDRIVIPGKSKSPLDVVVEEYYEWYADANAFVGDFTPFKGMVLTDNLRAYVDRKLFTLTTGHAAAAYIGSLKGYTTILECLDDEEVMGLLRGSMQQAGEGLVTKYGMDHDEHFRYIETTINRFRNPYLKDTLKRIGREPLRKLSPGERLMLPLMTAIDYELPYDKLLIAAGAALRFNDPDDAQSQKMSAMIDDMGLEAAIGEICGLLEDDEMIEEIAHAYFSAGEIESRSSSKTLPFRTPFGVF